MTPENTVRLALLLMVLALLMVGLRTSSPPPTPDYPRPRNCATATAYGLDAADIAARWPHLDRDKDGVACYGD